MESPLVAARQGFEPQYSPSKGEVLPLDDRAMFPRYTINPTLNLALQIRTFRNSNPQSAEISVADIFTIRLLRVVLFIVDVSYLHFCNLLPVTNDFRKSVLVVDVEVQALVNPIRANLHN